MIFMKNDYYPISADKVYNIKRKNINIMQMPKMTIKRHLSFNANRKKNKKKIDIIYYDEEKESNKK